MFMIQDKPVAQGDMLIRKIDALPKEAVLAKPEKDHYVLTHSESGHHHVVKKTPHVHFYAHANDNLRAYLVVDNKAKDTKVEHLRSHDTHESIGFPPGIYEINRQIESGLEGFRRAID